jgi:hypothetical protein
MTGVNAAAIEVNIAAPAKLGGGILIKSIRKRI